MNNPGSMNPSSRSSGTTRSLWHLSTWSDYINRMVHPVLKPSIPVHMTRRQQLLAAQDQKRKEHREHVLELLREVKEKHQHPTQETKLKA